eukprot:TRINITY_DN18161_c0_g1_i2.p2 TRINITY_DN18161_c0_g1~~TRINITY_DN18161_c0_g1_i2.p2  ORF type:complete len:107 (+),score=12.47 TRINITY_DN18161_c0_g1_i2:329-649(+)
MISISSGKECNITEMKFEDEEEVRMRLSDSITATFYQNERKTHENFRKQETFRIIDTLQFLQINSAIPQSLQLYANELGLISFMQFGLGLFLLILSTIVGVGVRLF